MLNQHNFTSKGVCTQVSTGRACRTCCDWFRLVTIRRNKSRQDGLFRPTACPRLAQVYVGAVSNVTRHISHFWGPHRLRLNGSDKSRPSDNTRGVLSEDNYHGYIEAVWVTSGECPTHPRSGILLIVRFFREVSCDIFNWIILGDIKGPALASAYWGTRD